MTFQSIQPGFRGCPSDSDNLLQTAAIRVICQILKEPLFNQLRTKEQLGYIVSSGYDLKFCVDGLIQMGYHEGVPSVWAGTVPSLVLVSQPTIKFTIYEFLKRYYLQLYGKLNLAAYSYYDSRNSIHKNLCDGINMNQFYNHLFI